MSFEAGRSVAEHAEAQGLEITSLNTPLHWLLIHAQAKASEQLVVYAKSKVATAVSCILQEQKTELVWKELWDHMVADVRVRKNYCCGLTM